MKTLVFYGIGDVRLEDRPTPEPKDGEVLLKIEACAICGTDVRIINTGHRAVQPPRITGHEISGTVFALGANVRNLQVGDRVVVVTPVGCGQCKFCKADMQNMCQLVSRDVHAIGYYCDGGFAEYMLVPKEAVANNNLIKFPANISHLHASLVEPLSCVLNGMRFLAIKPGEVVVIFGAGPIGCMHGLVAKSLGVKKVVMVDVSESKLELAKKTGAADLWINSASQNLEEIISKETDGAGADVAVTACPSPAAQELAVKITGIRGRISLFGGLPKDQAIIRFDSNDVHYAEKSVFGAFASAHPQYHEALEMIVNRKIDASKLITHTFKLEDFFQALEAIKKGETLKVVITP